MVSWPEDIFMVALVLGLGLIGTAGILLKITIKRRRFSRDIERLNEFASHMSQGDYTKTIAVSSQDELGQLAANFNNMASNLKESTSEHQLATRTTKLKNLFLANMSHEIRTPLNAILGFVELLKDPTLTAADRLAYLDIVSRTGETLATIINDILDISKVEAGKLEVESVACLLDQILKDIYNLLNLRCEEKGILLTFNYGKLPSYVKTDPARLKQILLNVVGNAIKFTKKGEVTVNFEVREKLLLCSVEDTGIGVANEHLDRLFQTFSQVDHSVRKEFGGTGLGLTLSKRIANLMGGDIQLVWSEPNVGSRFVVTVQLEDGERRVEARQKAKLPLASDHSLIGRKILIVEDSLDNQLLAQQYLLREGAQVEIAHHGGEALEVLAKNNFDLVLMDMQMPVMDGYTAATELRKRGCMTPIIALTAHAMREDLDKCLQAGCNQYLSKPYRRVELIHAVTRYCKNVA